MYYCDRAASNRAHAVLSSRQVSVEGDRPRPTYNNVWSSTVRLINTIIVSMIDINSIMCRLIVC